MNLMMHSLLIIPSSLLIPLLRWSSCNPDNNSSSLDSTDSSEEEDVIDEDGIENLILCQYEKVTRTKNKWKMYLKGWNAAY